MNNAGREDISDFKVDAKNLYREETITDLKVASIKVLTPIKADGSEDDSREQIFIGNTQLMSPEGPLPLQAPLDAENLDQAMEVFPSAMRQALNEMVERIKEMQRKEQFQGRGGRDSGIIIPGR